MKKSTDTGFIVSLHFDASPDTLRVNLTWQGDHDISAFDLDRFGQVLHYENGSENTGWALTKPSLPRESRRGNSSAKRGRNLKPPKSQQLMSRSASTKPLSEMMI
jgi:hypothetical protein